MVNLSNIINGFETEQARSIAYYLSRYFKGSPYLEKDGKDIFLDVFQDEQDARIRAATHDAIRAIESDVGVPVNEFDEATLISILDLITEFEEGITKTSSPEELRSAEEFLGSATGPVINTQAK